MKLWKSATVWRGVAGLLAAAAVVQMAIEFAAAPRVLAPGRAAAPLFSGSVLDQRGPTTLVVESLPAQSPLVAAGVLPGDRLRFEEPLGHWHTRSAGETVALTVVHAGAERRLQLTLPAATVPPRQWTEYVLSNAARIVTLLICTFFGLRRIERWSPRALAISGLLSCLRYPDSAPQAWHLPWLDYLASAGFALWATPMVLFALSFPDDQPTGWRARLLRVYRWLLAPYVLLVLAYFGALYAGWYEPVLQQITRVAGVVQPVLFVLGLALGWQAARGESRLRFQWIMATLGAIIGVWLLDSANQLVGRPFRGVAWSLFVNGTILLGTLGFGYAVVQRRIFDFGLALNRALIFSLVGALLFGAIQVVHAVAAEFLRVDDPAKAAVLSALLALAVYLSFAPLKRVVERGVDWLLFRTWREREQALERFAAEARLASDAGALAALFCAALERFSGAPAVRFWQRQAEGGYLPADGREPPAGKVDENEAAVLALRAHGQALRPEAGPLAGSALLLPLPMHGQLLGFAALAPRPDGLPWRADQVKAMESCAQEVASCLHALAFEDLRRQLEQERRRSELLQARLEASLTR